MLGYSVLIVLLGVAAGFAAVVPNSINDELAKIAEPANAAAIQDSDDLETAASNFYGRSGYYGGYQGHHHHDYPDYHDHHHHHGDYDHYDHHHPYDHHHHHDYDHYHDHYDHHHDYHDHHYHHGSHNGGIFDLFGLGFGK